MKTKILVILGIIILLIILSVIAIIAYFLIVDIQSKKPAEEIKECKIELYRAKNLYNNSSRKNRQIYYIFSWRIICRRNVRRSLEFCSKFI